MLGVGFQCAGDKAFVCRVGNVAPCAGEGSGTDLIAPHILSTGLSVLRKSTEISCYSSETIVVCLLAVELGVVIFLPCSQKA